MQYLPVITVGAFYSAVALLQIGQRNFQKLPTTFLFAVVSLFLMVYIVDSYGASLGWTLLGIPAAILVLGAIFHLDLRPVRPSEEPTDTCECPCCNSRPCSCIQACPQPKPKRC